MTSYYIFLLTGRVKTYLSYPELFSFFIISKEGNEVNNKIIIIAIGNDFSDENQSNTKATKLAINI